MKRKAVIGVVVIGILVVGAVISVLIATGNSSYLATNTITPASTQPIWEFAGNGNEQSLKPTPKPTPILPPIPVANANYVPLYQIVTDIPTVIDGSVSYGQLAGTPPIEGIDLIPESEPIHCYITIKQDENGNPIVLRIVADVTAYSYADIYGGVHAVTFEAHDINGDWGPFTCYTKTSVTLKVGQPYDAIVEMRSNRGIIVTRPSGYTYTGDEEASVLVWNIVSIVPVDKPLPPPPRCLECR